MFVWSSRCSFGPCNWPATLRSQRYCKHTSYLSLVACNRVVGMLQQCGIYEPTNIGFTDSRPWGTHVTNLQVPLPGRMSRDSLFGIATRYGLDGPGIESRWETRFSAPVQTGPGAQPTSYTIHTGSLSGVKRRWPPTSSSAEVKERVELDLYSPFGPSWRVLGWIEPLPLPFYLSQDVANLRPSTYGATAPDLPQQTPPFSCLSRRPATHVTCTPVSLKHSHPVWCRPSSHPLRQSVTLTTCDHAHRSRFQYTC